MKKRSGLILAAAFIAMSGCNSSDDVSQTGGSSVKGAVFKDGHHLYQYDYNENGCDTGSHSFSSLHEYCQALKDEDLNHGCASGFREQDFKDNCTNLPQGSSNPIESGSQHPTPHGQPPVEPGSQAPAPSEQHPISRCSLGCDVDPRCEDLAKRTEAQYFPQQTDNFILSAVSLTTNNPHPAAYQLEYYGTGGTQSKPGHLIIISYGYEDATNPTGACRVEMVDDNALVH